MRYHHGMSKASKPRNPDHVRRTNRPSPDNAVITERLKSLMTPAVFGQLAYCWAARRRPLPESVLCVRQTFVRIFVVDGSTLEALFRKLQALQDVPAGSLAGKICTVIDLATRLPEQIWFTEAAQAHDTNFTDQILTVAPAQTLWVFDRGFLDFTFFEALIAKGVAWITRAKSNTVCTVQRVLLQTTTVCDRIVLLDGDQVGARHPVRLIEVRFGTTWYRYLTSVLDPAILPAGVVADLYRRRWRIEEAFQVRQTAAEPGLFVDRFAEWRAAPGLEHLALLCRAGRLGRRRGRRTVAALRLHLAGNGLPFMQASTRGEATDLIKYLAAPENRDLGVVKRLRKKPDRVERVPAPYLTSPTGA